MTVFELRERIESSVPAWTLLIPVAAVVVLYVIFSPSGTPKKEQAGKKK